MASGDDTKNKVLVPKDLDGNGKLGNDFTDYRAAYGGNSGVQDDLPAQPQPPAGNVIPVSLRSARQRAGQDSLLNKNQIGASDTPLSDNQYLLEVDKSSTINRPSQTFTLGQFIKKGTLGQRPNLIDDGDKKLGEDILREINPQKGTSTNPFARTLSPNTTLLPLEKPFVDPDTGPVVEKTVSAVLSQNRFSSIDSFRPRTEEFKQPDDISYTTAQGFLGAYEPDSKKSPTVTLEQMKGIAEALLSAAIGVPNTSSGGASAEVSQNDVRFGEGRIPADSMQMKNTVFSPFAPVPQIKEKASTGKFTEPGLGGVVSYGQLNTPDVPFGGLAPIEMITLAFLTLGTTALFLAGGSLILGLGGAILGADESPGNKPYSLGSFEKTNRTERALGALISRRDFGLSNTKSTLPEALQAGILSLLGVGGAGDTTSAQGALDLAKALANITRSPGFYVVFCRAIFRSAASLGDFYSNLTELAPGQPGALAFIEQLASSKIVGAINALSAVGDALLTGDASPYNLDRLSIAPMKSRSGKGSGEQVTDMRLAWRSATAPSMVLLSPNAIFAQRSLNRNVNGLNLAGAEGVHLMTKASGRISKEDVSAFESGLDAEYVPFYFHDLRTNEIVSFHAFLTSLSDDFNANYNDVRAIGRADPIRIYQNTTRSISFNFYAAATSKEDFDALWAKINKLVTLLYPQYTKGRTVTGNKAGDKQDSFIMPFSQVVGASPMIRLRIGDVIRSNYSRFNLSRLFGLGEPDFIPDSESLPVTADQFKEFFAAEMPEVTREINEATDSARNPGSSLAVGDIVKVSYPSVQYLDKKKGFGDRAAQVVGGFASAFTPPSRFHLPFRDVFAKIAEVPPAPTKSSFASLGNAINHGLGNNIAPVYGVKLYASLEDAQRNSELPSAKGAVYKLSHHEASIFPEGLVKVREIKEKFIKDKLSKVGGEQGADLNKYFDSVQKFFSSDPKNGNAVVRSFEESGGRGLPGFLSRISFDWINDNTTWETSHGSRAPKICEIRMSFDPVHDIAPGIDHRGVNRAPVYPVGEYARDLSNAEDIESLTSLGQENKGSSLNVETREATTHKTVTSTETKSSTAKYSERTTAIDKSIQRATSD